jgi:galactose mutarotase-like enzyme
MTRPSDIVALTSPSGRLRAVVAPSLGAELCGLQLVQDGTARELLYRGMDFTPTDGWQGRAPILWPAIGRNFPLGSRPEPSTFRDIPLGWSHGGVSYPMPLHGFARSQLWKVCRRDAADIELELIDSIKTRQHYPFGFTLRATYGLTDAALFLRLRVSADSRNEEAMPFVLGNHITFRTPLEGRGLDGAAVSGPSARRWPIDPVGRPAGPVSEDPRFAGPCVLNDLIGREVVVLEGSPREPCAAVLTDPSGLVIIVSHALASPEADVPRLLTLWGEPAAGYLSLEPWLGLPNALASSVGAVRLEAGQTLDWSMTVKVGP